MRQPKFRHVPRLDRSWNTTRVLGPVDPNKPIPTIVVHQGTLVIDDRVADSGLPPVEIKNMHVTLVNDPTPIVNIQASGQSLVAEMIHVKGNYHRVSSDTTVGLQLGKVPLGPTLLSRVAFYCPEAGRHFNSLEGTGSLDGQVQYRSTGPRQWEHELCFKVTGGRFTHPQLPAPLDHLDATLHCYDGTIRLDSLTANAGTAHVSLTGSIQGLSADANCQGTLKISNWALTKETLDRLPENLKAASEDFRPRGPVNATVNFSRTDNRWARRAIVEPQGITASFVNFEYPLDQDRKSVV